MYAGNIERAGKTLLSIINDILDFSKIEAGKAKIVEGDYRLSAVLNDVVNMIFFKTKEKGLEFNICVDRNLPDGLYGDEVHVRQVLTNILNNAVKYTNHGSVELDVRRPPDDRMEAGQTVHLLIAVRDTGIGIKPEDIDKLFTKFQRVDLDSNSTVEGTGLGLAITRSLLTMMNGSIRVESEYGAGSTFTITLPQKIVSCEAVGDIQTRFGATMRPVGAHEETFQAPDARVLIVDDTPMNLMVAVGLLKNTGVNIDTADGGEEALALTRARVYDLILMDQRMPKMDGVEALHRIRTQAEGVNRDTPVICLTADAIIGAKERYMAEGFTDYLTKPIDSQALEQMMTRYLPVEKVTVIKREVQGAADTNQTDVAEDGYAPLRQAGINPDIGLQYCQKDRTLYHALLREYAAEAENKMRAFRGYCEARDWTNYSILAHSLKSTSRTIGAMALSQIAAKLENVADSRRAEDVVAEHGLMLECYANTVRGIRAALQTLEAAEDGDDMMQFDSNDDIMEFMPE